MAFLVALVLLAFTSEAYSSEEGFPELQVIVGDTTAPSGQQNSVITVYCDNFLDTIAGFNLWLKCSNPDILEFQTDTEMVTDTFYYKCLTYEDTVCTDSILTIPTGDWDFFHIVTSEVFIGNFDTTSTLISGWEFVDARSLGNGFDVNIAAIADQSGGGVTSGFAPQQGGVLIKVLADVFDIPDTAQERTVDILIEYQFIDHFSFSKPDGSSIGIAYEPIMDTNYWVCVQWVGDSCVEYERTQSPPYDSIEIVPDSVPYIDTTVVLLTHGELTVLQPPPYMCGDMQGDQVINIVDLTYLVAYLFNSGPAPDPLEAGDINCDDGSGAGDGSINIVDLTSMVAYLFSGGVAPCDFCP